MQYVIGIDTGTTGVKAKIYDLEGRIHGESYREYGCEYPRPGWIDQDITMLDRANDQVLSEVIARSHVDPADIVSIAVSTQRALHLYLDAEGNILRDGKGISWQDSRCEEQVQWIRETLGDRFYDLTGLPPSTVWVAPEILWVQRHEPDVYARTAKIVTTQEYFLHRLGASDAWRVDYSNGSLFGLMNIETFEWDDELLDAFGIDVGLLPELVPSGVAVGNVDEAAAARTGLRAGTPIVTGGGDQQCAAVGAGVIAEGLAEVTLGTAGVSIAHLDSPRFDPDRKIACSASAIAGERRWISEGLQAAAASSYRWYRDTIGYIGREVENLGGANAYDVLNEMVLNTAPGSSGLLFMPYLAGSVAPNFDSQARGAFLGLTISHDTGTMARSVMEGVLADGQRAARDPALGWGDEERGVVPDPDRRLQATDRRAGGGRVRGAGLGDTRGGRSRCLRHDGRRGRRHGAGQAHVRAGCVERGRLRRGLPCIPGELRGAVRRRGVRGARRLPEPVGRTLPGRGTDSGPRPGGCGCRPRRP
jgi:xylulokinase